MRIVLIAHGTFFNSDKLLASLNTFDQIIAVDGGLNYCRQFHIQPHLIIGDFDSVQKSLLAHYSDIPKIHFPTDKDKTDLEIAIEHAMTRGTELSVFGALGGRADHTLYNLSLLTRYPGKVTFYNEEEKVSALLHKTKIEMSPGQKISLLPINGPVLGITTRGLKWELVNASFDPHFMSISNEAMKTEVEISFQKGNLLCFI